ncbi:hypothetical protein DSB67_23885 [Vibrio campbellii]|nr:hypothetical protein DSB67_23885 [Vibrio campbellii]
MKHQEQQRLSDLYFKIRTFFLFFINLRSIYLFE